MADENYSVASTLSVKDELTAALMRAAAEAKKLDSVLGGLKQASPFARMTETINNITKAARGASAAARDMGTVFSRAGSLAARGLADAANEAERLQRALEGASRVKAPTFGQGAYAQGSRASSAAHGPVFGGGGAAGAAYRQRVGTQPSTVQFRAAAMSGAFGHGPFAAAAAAGMGPIGIPPVPPGAHATYNIHTGGAPPVPPVPPAGLGGGGGSGRYAGIVDGAVLMQGGMWATQAGHTIGDAIFDAIKSGADVIRQQNLLWASGMSQADQAAAMSAAQSNSYKLPMFNVAENLKSLGELRSVAGSMSEAIQMLPGMNQYQMISSAVGANGASAYTAARTGEMLGWLRFDKKTGRFDEDRYTQFMNFMAAAQIATHGKVNDRQMYNFAQRGSLAAKNMSILGLQNMVPIINEIGGNAAGTALTSINQQFLGGVMPQRVFDELDRLKLVERAGRGKNGKRVPGGAEFKGLAQLGDNPVAWVEDVMIPAMQKAGVSDKGQVQEIMKLFGRSTSQREAGIIATQMLQIAKDVQMQQQVRDPSSILNQFMKSDVSLAAGNTMGAFQHAMENIGVTVGPQAVHVLNEITNFLNNVAKFARANPGKVRWMVDIAAGAAVAAVAIGTIMTIAGGVALFAAILGTPAGLAAAGVITAIAAAMGAVVGLGAVAAKIDWSKFFDWKSKMSGLDKQIMGIGPAIWNKLTSTFDWLKKQILSIVPGFLMPGPSTAVPKGDPGKGLRLAPPPGPDPNNSVNSTGHKNSRGQMIYEPQHTAFIHALKHALNGVAVQMDGEKVGTLVTQHQVNAMRRPTRGKSAFDNTQNPRRTFHATNQWA